MMTVMLAAPGAVTSGSYNQINGRNKRPIDAVNTSSTATSLSLKKRSTRYLSRCTEIAQNTGPANAKTSQDIACCPFPGRGAARSAAKWCAADPGCHELGV